MGVVSVSPVARQQTSDTTNESATAISPRKIEMWKARYCTITRPMVMGMSPITIHEAGTSMASIAALWAGRSLFLKRVKARASVRHWSATVARLEKTMIEVPPHNAQRVGLKSAVGLQREGGHVAGQPGRGSGP